MLSLLHEKKFYIHFAEAISLEVHVVRDISYLEYKFIFTVCVLQKEREPWFPAFLMRDKKNYRFF